MEEDLFSLDDFVSTAPPPSATTPSSAAPSFSFARLAPEEQTLDPPSPSAAPSPRPALAALLSRERASLSGESVARALTASFASWLSSGHVSEPVAASVPGQLAAASLDAAAALRARAERLDAFGAGERTVVEEEARQMLWEAGTWELLQRTITDLRAAESDAQTGTLVAEAASDRWVSDEQFFLIAGRYDATARRFRRVVGWLEHVYHTQTVSSGSVRSERFWEATERALQRGMSVERDAQTGAESVLVTQLDPDAPLRQEKSLHSVDETIDARLLRRVWELVRAGRIGQAVAECNACQQQWRSAVLMGMLPYHDPKIVNETDPDDAHGNSNPALLRQICAKMAACTKMNTHERAVYGLFAGHIGPVLSVSSSYHDFLWAHYKVALLHRVLLLRGGVAGGGGDFGGGLQQHLQGGLHVDALAGEAPFLPASMSDEEVLAAVSSMSPEMAQQAQLPHARIQRAVILGDLNELVVYLNELQTTPDCSIHLHRFATTLLLMLSKVRVPSFNPSPLLLRQDADRSIRVYLDSVIGALERPALVVALALQLPEESQAASVAKFVAESVAARSIQESKELEVMSLIAHDERVRDMARKQDRRSRYIQAFEAGGLDTVKVLMQVFDNLLPPSSFPVRSYHFDNANTGASVLFEEADEGDTMGSHSALIEILGWLTVRLEHWKESVAVANAVSRQLALRHRVSHIRDVLRALPATTLDKCRAACLSELRGEASFAFEIEFWRALCDSYDAFAAWHAGRFTSDVATVGALYEGAEAALRRVVDFPEFPLFSSSSSSSSEGMRHAQLVTIRENYIPQVFMMLHNLHFHSRRYDLSLALADDVANGRKRLWSVFVKTGMLERFLQLLKESSMALLAQGHTCIIGFDSLA